MLDAILGATSLRAVASQMEGVMDVTLVAIGRMKDGPERELCNRYLDRARKTGRPLGFRGFDVREASEAKAARLPSGCRRKRRRRQRSSRSRRRFSALMPPASFWTATPSPVGSITSEVRGDRGRSSLSVAPTASRRS